ncbi:MAG: hypothetical protein DCF20_14900 [Pseudanabaena sp.]|nr:MAG: hypothetical protein DCF20_14900 [Pseudanabaena sp.]
MTDKKKQLPLATFRIAPDKANVWEKFKAKVEDNKTTGAALFWQFVQNYVDGVDTNIDVSTYHVDSNLDERIDLALEAKVDFSIRNISRVADEQYERLVALLAQNNIDIDERIDSALNSPRRGNEENEIAPLLAKIDSIESTIGSQDDKIAALEAIVIGLPTTFISTEQVEAIFEGAISPLLARLEPLETNRSDVTPPANTTQALLQKAKEVATNVTESRIETDALPIIEAIANITAPSIENPLPDANLSDTAAASAIDINKAMEIAQKHGYTGNAQTLRNWSKRSFTNKTAEAQNESKAKLKEIGLMPHYDGENYVWLVV